VHHQDHSALAASAVRTLRCLLVLAICATGSASAQRQKHAERIAPDPPPVSYVPGWFSGDTHEHIQHCDSTVHPLSEIRERMDAEDLNVANVLIWNYTGVPYTEFICNVTGGLDPLSNQTRLLQYGVETSYLSCARWGHLIGLNIGPEQARIARGFVIDGACADMPGLGLGGDGTGWLNALIAQRFLTAPAAVCGYAHTVWTIGTYHPLGYDWNASLLASGFTTDAAYLDPAQRLAVPDVPKLMGIGYPIGAVRAFYPLLGAMDAALGNVQFVETVIMGEELPVNVSPPGHWTELYYKLLSAGVRVTLAGGTDRACLNYGTSAEYVRTYVHTGANLTYDAWTKGLAAGRTSIATGPGKFLRLTLGGVEAGGMVRLFTPHARSTASVELKVVGPINDSIDLVVDGEVRDSRTVALSGSGNVLVTFDDVFFPESSWVAVRLGTQTAHTGAIYVIVDDKPVVDPLAAEYWMLWCDIVTKTTLDHPELAFFRQQSGTALALIAQARRAFKSLRDVHGFDPTWGVTRYGVSTQACRGPISIGVTGPARSGESLLLTCTNAPPLAEGVLYLSRVQDLGGTCNGDFLSLVDTTPASLIGAFPAHATHSGYAEVQVPSVPDGDPFLFAQFVWTNPPGCPGVVTCFVSPQVHSASDALSFVVEVPVLTSLAVTPTNPSIALGTGQQFTAMGTFSNGTIQDLTGTVTWSSSDASVAVVSNASGSRGLASSVAVGTTTISATDAGTGISGATTLAITPAVLLSIEVTPTNPSIALGTSQQFTAIGIYSDGTHQDLTDTLTWSSSDASVAVVSNAPGERGFASSVAVGTTTIAAADGGSGLSGVTTLTVTPAVLVSIEVTPASPSIALGTSLQFTAIGIFSDGAHQDVTQLATWSSSDPSVAGVSNAPKDRGLATGVVLGSTTIAASVSGISGMTTLTVTPAVLTAIDVTPTNGSIALGTQQQFTAIGIYTDSTTQDLTGVVTWSSSLPAVAAISNAPGSHGLATSLSVGVTTIAALEPASGVSGATTLTVTPAVLLSIEVTPTNPSIPLGTQQQFTAIGIYTDSTTQDLTGVVTWSSSNPVEAAISNAPGSQGLATSISVGATTIAALEPESGISGATTLTVTPAILVSLQVTPVEPSIALGFTQQFTATGTYSDATSQDLTGVVTWSSSNPAVASVSNAPGSQGLATSFAEGETMIAATDSGSGVSDATALTVTPAELLSIEVTPADPSIALGFTQQFTATGFYSDATTQDLTGSVTWTSLVDAVATVSNVPGSRGLATSVAVGVTTIAAADPENGIGGATTLTVTPAILLAIEVTPDEPSIALGFTQQFTALGTYSDASTLELTDSVTWSSSSPSVATVSNAPGSHGLATSVAQGVTSISATDPESGVSGATTLTVTPPVLISIALSPASPTIGLGTTRQFSATGIYSDATTQDFTNAVTWSSSEASDATISNTPGSHGLASGVGVGTTTITATDVASGISGATTLTVKAVLLSIQITPANSVVAEGRTKQFTAIGTFNDGGTQDITASVTWSSSNTAVATISNAPSSHGFASGLVPGTVTIAATDPETGIGAATLLTVIKRL